MIVWDEEGTFCFFSSSDVGGGSRVSLFSSTDMQICDSIKKMIGEINLGLVVVDGLLNPGFDAYYSLDWWAVQTLRRTY